jgi:hypothetical protein
VGRSCSFVTIEPSQLSTPASQGITATIVPKSPRAVGSLLGTIVSKAHRWESDGDHFATCVIRGLEVSFPNSREQQVVPAALSPLAPFHASPVAVPDQFSSGVPLSVPRTTRAFSTRAASPQSPPPPRPAPCPALQHETAL